MAAKKYSLFAPLRVRRVTRSGWSALRGRALEEDGFTWIIYGRAALPCRFLPN